MRIAALSDIHGNIWALEAVLADIERLGVDALVNTGDILSGSLDQPPRRFCSWQALKDHERLVVQFVPQSRFPSRIQRNSLELRPD